MEIKKCSSCKSYGVPMIRYAKSKDGSKSYYYCRECNNTKARKYYLNGGREKIRKANKKYYLKKTGRYIDNTI